MKIDIDDASLNYVYNLLTHILPHTKGEEKRQLKRLLQKLEPPRADIRLTGKQTAILVGILTQSLSVLESKDDEHSQQVKGVLSNMANAITGG